MSSPGSFNPERPVRTLDVLSAMAHLPHLTDDYVLHVGVSGAYSGHLQRHTLCLMHLRAKCGNDIVKQVLDNRVLIFDVHKPGDAWCDVCRQTHNFIR